MAGYVFRCVKTLVDGERCTQDALPGTHRCAEHSAPDPPPVFQCVKTLPRGRCTRDALPGTHRCRLHTELPDAERCQGATVDHRRCRLRVVEGTTRCRLHQNGPALPPPLPPPEQLLHRLAVDKQNVHTGPVMQMMRETFADIDTAAELGPPRIDAILAGMRERVKVVADVAADMRKWYKRSMCINPGDYKYRRALNAVWDKIETLTGERRQDYTQRLYTECREAVGMCYTGHMARLANVCVGMDDAPVIEGAVTKIGLPDKMAHIAGIADMEERMEAAYRAFAEYNVTDTEEWIRALVEA